MKKVIVTGANGFVGSALVKELLNNDYEVVALDLKGNSENLPKDDRRISFIGIDLSDTEKLMNFVEKDDYEAFYHLAWAGSSGEARADVCLQLRNANWTVQNLRAAKALGCRRFVCAGSIMEHEAVAAAYKQGNRPGPGYIYGCGKLAAHIMSMSVAASINMELIWAEITNAYGPGEFSSRLVNATLRKCINGEVPRFTAGTQNYDFVYIDDVARAFRMIAEKGKPFHEYIIGSSKAKPLRDFLLEMKQSVAPELDFIFGELPYTGVNLPLEKFSCKKTEQDTGFRALISFDEGTKRTMQWLKAMEG